MVQIEDEIYNQLKKDADDNKQIVRIVRIVSIVLIFFILFFSWGKRLIDIDIQRRTIEVEMSAQISQAETNKRVMEIEKSDLTNDEYFKWLSVR